ncbi:MAG: hypothetical protein Q8R97_05240 [Brevundimonas sp.]|nr:hypothetical protein [Brevundimonas sp.]
MSAREGPTDHQIRRRVWRILLGCEWRFKRTDHGFIIHRSFSGLVRIAGRRVFA